MIDRKNASRLRVSVMVVLFHCLTAIGQGSDSTTYGQSFAFEIQDPATVTDSRTNGSVALVQNSVAEPPVEAFDLQPVPEAPNGPFDEHPVLMDNDPAPTDQDAVKAPPAMNSSPQQSSKPTNTTNSQPNENAAKKAEEKTAALKKAAAGAHKLMHYDNDFSYLNDPAYDGALLGDGLKRLCFGDHITYDIGGQNRFRLHSENNHRGLGLTGNSDDFLLRRTRLYLNAELGDRIRFFGETLDAISDDETFSPRSIEENRWELQNLFFDVKLFDIGSASTVGRIGRQEIALGDQRYVSPLDWGNTRRTFDGGRLTISDADWTADGFWLRPMIHDRNGVDDADSHIDFYGVYLSTKSAPNGQFDTYWLALDNNRIGFAYDSFGARYKGKIGETLVDAEGAFQTGKNSDGSDHHGGFFTVGAGKQFDKLPLKGTHWLYFDWANGTDVNGAGNGHNDYFPLAHKYLGFMDLYGRSNIMDFNWFSVRPIGDKLNLVTWLHNFWLQDVNDTPYNVNMSPFAPGVVGIDPYLGTELDIMLTQSLTPRSNIVYGYSYFWAGDYYDTPGLPTNQNASFFYTQYTLNF